MTLFIVILFLSAFVPGMIIINKPGYKSDRLHYWLIFAGAYIFSITIVHLIPELFSQTQNYRMLGLLILAGFFMQIFIDFLTSGIEHGHAHKHIHTPIWALLFGLCLHALMDGAILVHPTSGGDVSHSSEHGSGLLAGIVAHKIPAAIVLITVLSHSISGKGKLIFLLLLFSLSSPLGLLLGNFLQVNHLLEGESLNYVFAIVSGNFLHISTTIYFETSPHHHFNYKKVLYALLGAVLAVGIELLH